MTITQSPLAVSIDGFARAGAGTNRSAETIRTYRTDLARFLTRP